CCPAGAVVVLVVGGGVTLVVVVVGGGVLVAPDSVGVVQLRHCDRFPALLGAIRNVLVVLPLFFRNFCRYACIGAFHSLRIAQWVVFVTSDQYEMLSIAPSAR